MFIFLFNDMFGKSTYSVNRQNIMDIHINAVSDSTGQ